MEESLYSEFSKFPRRRRRCCRRGMQLALVGLMIAALWAGLLTLLLLWHWDTVRNLKQLEEAAALNVSQVSKDLERHKGDQMAQKSQAAQMLQDMARIQAEQKRMVSQESELFRNLDGLRADLSNLKSYSLNERHRALHSLGRLQEEVEKLWLELHESNGLVVMEAVLALLRGAGMGQQASRLQKEQKFNHRAFNLEGNLGVTA